MDLDVTLWSLVNIKVEQVYRLFCVIVRKLCLSVSFMPANKVLSLPYVHEIDCGHGYFPLYKLIFKGTITGLLEQI